MDARDIPFLRSVVLSNAPKDIRQEALDKLLLAAGATTHICGHKVTVEEYHAIKAKCLNGEKIMAIKLLRETTRTGNDDDLMGLKEAKESIEQFMLKLEEA